jgi:hypothetical protein
MRVFSRVVGAFATVNGLRGSRAGSAKPLQFWRHADTVKPSGLRKRLRLGTAS